MSVAAEGLLAIRGAVARDFFEFLGSDAGERPLAGSRGWFAGIAALIVFNTALGEDYLASRDAVAGAAPPQPSIRV
jgi:hypothetical protein